MKCKYDIFYNDFRKEEDLILKIIPVEKLILNNEIKLDTFSVRKTPDLNRLIVAS